jgi:tetraprenyl-beta-curcumene synthase
VVAVRETAAVLAAFGIYRARIVPPVRRQLVQWRQDAAAIPDPALRAQALAAIDRKGQNVEAIAVLATLAPPRRRAPALRAMVALQVAVDYLDELGEKEGDEPLRDGLQLHRALEAAVTPRAAKEDWYRFHPQREDGGYLDRLVASTQESVARLPARAAVLPSLRAAARRCGEGQSHTHAAAARPRVGEAGPSSLASWASRLDAPPIYRWWEVAAGASSSVAAHALIAAAADPTTTAAAAELVDRAYFPPIGALTVLLDDLVDRRADAAEGEHNYLDYCADPTAAANRLALIAELAAAALGPLPRRDRHAAILAGVLGFYLGAQEEMNIPSRQIADRLLESAGPGVRLVVAIRRQ